MYNEFMFLESKYKDSIFFLVQESAFNGEEWTSLKNIKIIIEARTIKELECKIIKKYKTMDICPHVIFLWQMELGQILKCQYIKPEFNNLIIGPLNQPSLIILEKNEFEKITKKYKKDKLKNQLIKIIKNI